MFGRSCVVSLALLIPSIAQAGPLQEASNRIAQQEAAQPAPRGWSKTRWSGLALAGAGAALITIGLVEDKQSGPDTDQIQEQSTTDIDRESRSDKTWLWTGIGAAALGGTLFVLGGGKGPRATVSAGKVAVLQTLGF
jgi:hypothetical protein